MKVDLILLQKIPNLERFAWAIIVLYCIVSAIISPFYNKHFLLNFFWKFLIAFYGLSCIFFLGFIPTFGPAFIHLYGSTRDYNFIDEHSNLNDGLGEGVSYRGRILIALKTDISDSIDTAPSEVEVMPTQTINEVKFRKPW